MWKLALIKIEVKVNAALCIFALGYIISLFI